MVRLESDLILEVMQPSVKTNVDTIENIPVSYFLELPSSNQEDFHKER
jgi:hypothetical protein